LREPPDERIDRSLSRGKNGQARRRRPISIGRIIGITPDGRFVSAVTWDDGQRAEIDLAPIVAAHPRLAALAHPDDFPVAAEAGWSVEWRRCGIDFGAAQLRRWADERAA
jgi:hypothetical protein